MSMINLKIPPPSSLPPSPKYGYQNSSLAAKMLIITGKSNYSGGKMLLILSTKVDNPKLENYAKIVLLHIFI